MTCQGFKPDSGNPTVRHYRGASGNVCHGETVTPSRNRKSANGNPSPTAGRARFLSRPKRGVALSTLHHVIDLEWMKEAYRLTRKDGAPGIDGVTAADYADKPGGQSLGPPGSHQVGPLSSAAGAAGIYSEGGWIAAAPRPSNLRGQGVPEGDCHGAWRPSTSRTFFPALTASGRVALLIRPCRSCVRAS